MIQQIVTFDVYWIHHKNHYDVLSDGYVGISSNVDERFKKHKKLNTNKHLSNSILKYKDNVMFDVIHSGLEQELAEFVEFEYRSKENIGWNIAIGGGIPPNAKGRKKSKQSIDKWRDTRHGYTHSDETRMKISKTKIGTKHTKEHNKKIGDKHMKIVECIESGEIFNSIQDAAIYANLKDGSGIGRVCNGIVSKAGGYTWRYLL